MAPALPCRHSLQRQSNFPVQGRGSCFRTVSLELIQIRTAYIQLDHHPFVFCNLISIILTFKNGARRPISFPRKFLLSSPYFFILTNFCVLADHYSKLSMFDFLPSFHHVPIIKPEVQLVTLIFKGDRNRC
jgi:hypothetical protein